MKIRGIVATATVAVAATLAFAPSAHAVIGDCSDSHDVEVHVTQDQCVQLDWPTA